MRLRGQNRKDVYKLFTLWYKHYTGMKFRWETGEKSKVAQAFAYVADTLDIEDEELFDVVFEVWRDYLEMTVQDWHNWKGGNRYNIVGYISKKGRIVPFASKYKKGDTEFEDEGFDRAGLSGKEAWDV